MENCWYMSTFNIWGVRQSIIKSMGCVARIHAFEFQFCHPLAYPLDKQFHVSVPQIPHLSNG